MSVESAADRAAFLADFGEVITWTVGAAVSSLTVIAHAGTTRMEAEDGAAVLNNRATLQCREADIPLGAARGNAVGFRSLAHIVKSIEPDGAGMAVILLEEVVAD